MMDEARYNQLVSAAFKRILAAADGIDPDILEADSTGDMVTLTAASREKCIVNTQRAVRQVWVAGRGQGIHFDYDAAAGPGRTTRAGAWSCCRSSRTSSATSPGRTSSTPAESFRSRLPPSHRPRPVRGAGPRQPP